MSVRLSTPRQLINFAEQRFRNADLYYGHGTDNPYDEAVYLVLRTLGLPFDVSNEILDEDIETDKQQLIITQIDKRIQTHMPVAYLLNEAWFAGLPFYIDNRALIPRSPIAELIREKFLPWLDKVKVRRILDIGTGSGCIAIACAKAFPAAHVDAVDVSKDALAVTEKNIIRHKVDARIQLIQSDLYSCLPGYKYDLIVANPPYVSYDELAQLPAEYRHEPVTALQAGRDGLDILRRLLNDTKDFLNYDGILVVEVGDKQDAVTELYPQLPFVWLDFEHGGEGVFLITANNLR